jgi:hypothetical protein
MIQIAGMGGWNLDRRLLGPLIRALKSLIDLGYPTTRA